MLKLNKSDNKGFTIIETMIVLAIAGLILLIVFLAVPALQRNARNTQRKNDAASILAGVSSFISNNNGNPPTSVGKAATNNDLLLCVDIASLCNTSPSGTTKNTESAKLGYYSMDPSQAGGAGVTLANSLSGLAWPDVAHIIILTGYSCPDTQGSLPTATNLSSRSAVALFSLESGGNNPNHQCQEQ
ncbi:MAG TPA: type II secretion system protein [Candidatus Saccharimonadales bacterium]|nr:type II secretion system protein [Candidatus Saccharimonadales bacterium]